MYPVMLGLKGHSCLVVGGGGVALRKVDGLVADGAKVTVIAPAPMAALEALAQGGAIDLEKRTYDRGEAAGYELVFAATNDRAVNQRVFDDARSAGIWVNVADDPERCTFQLPARVQRGAMQLAIASAGEAPFVVRRLRQLLERRFGPEWAEWMESAGRFRSLVRESELSKAEEEGCFDRFFRETVNWNRLTVSVLGEDDERELLAVDGKGRDGDGRPRRSPGWAQKPRGMPGLVSLVGAGPGDPGLLTIRARQRLLAADAIVYDRLAATALPCDLPSGVEIHCVGKAATYHPVPQSETNALLVRLALEGKRVVRLKGGDPVVFGRGGEEALVLVEAGVPFEIVPSVTAGVAVPAYAGIPVTSRNEAVRVTLVTAHEALKSSGPQARWDLLASDRHATIVGYMGVTRIEGIVEELLSAGMDPETPSAMIERGTTSRQRVVRSPIRELPRAVASHGIRPPGLFVVGPTVKHADKLDWFGSRPLQGQRLVIPEPMRELTAHLEIEGAEVVVVPLPVTDAARIVLSALPLTGAVLQSANEVDSLEEERHARGWNTEVVAWCIGESAARRARELAWPRIEELDEATDAAAHVADNICAKRLRAVDTRRFLDWLEDPSIEPRWTVLDVRHAKEATPYIERFGSERWLSLPYDQIRTKRHELPTDRTPIIVCDAGSRSKGYQHSSGKLSRIW